MLKGIDQVNWEALLLAEGMATAVPFHLRAISSVSAQARVESLRWLFSSVAPDRAVYPAALHVVPFLIQVAGRENLADREWVFHLLGHLGRGRTPLSTYGRESTRSLHDRYTREQQEKWVSSTRDAVAAGWMTYVEALQSSDPQVRLHAPYVLAICGQGPEIAEALRRAIRIEKHALAKASMVIGLAHVGDLMDGVLLHDLMKGPAETLLVRWAAAAAEVAIWKGQASPDAVNLLIDILSNAAPARALHGMLPWVRVDFDADTAEILGGIAATHAPPAVPRLIKLFAVAPESSALVLALALLRLGFETWDPSKPLDPLQRDIVTALARSHRYGSASPLKRLCEEFNLPGTREELLQLP